MPAANPIKRMSLVVGGLLASLLVACQPAPSGPPRAWPASRDQVFAAFAAVWSGGPTARPVHRPKIEGATIPESYSLTLSPALSMTVFVTPQAPVREAWLGGTPTPSRADLERAVEGYVAAVSPSQTTIERRATARRLVGKIREQSEGELSTPDARIAWSVSGPNHDGFSLSAVPRGGRFVSEF